MQAMDANLGAFGSEDQSSGVWKPASYILLIKGNPHQESSPREASGMVY
jgi:hypothetical protein